MHSILFYSRRAYVSVIEDHTKCVVECRSHQLVRDQGHTVDLSNDRPHTKIYD